MSEGVLGYGLGGALGGAFAAHSQQRAREIARAQVVKKLYYCSSASDAPMSMPSAGPIYRPTLFPSKKPAPLLGETYMYPDERPVEPL